MGMILRIASSRIVGQGDIVGRSGYFSLNLSANSVMRGRLDARRTLKSLVADLRFNTQFNMCKFIDKDIPAFSKPVNLGDGKEELEYDIMEEIVSQHYLSIISKVNAILEDVKNKTETDNKNKEKNMPKDHNHKAWKE